VLCIKPTSIPRQPHIQQEMGTWVAGWVVRREPFLIRSCWERGVDRLLAGFITLLDSAATTSTVAGASQTGLRSSVLLSLQGYLAHKKTPSHRALQKDYLYLGPHGGPGGGGGSCERGNPVHKLLVISPEVGPPRDAPHKIGSCVGSKGPTGIPRP